MYGGDKWNHAYDILKKKTSWMLIDSTVQVFTYLYKYQVKYHGGFEILSATRLNKWKYIKIFIWSCGISYLIELLKGLIL